MKGQDFYNDIKELFEQQRRQESSIDFDQLLITAGGEDEITPSRSGNELSEFVVDPTLFSLLRDYNETNDDKFARRILPQQHTNNDDSSAMTTITTTTKKPQARDVVPQRVLDEENGSIVDSSDDDACEEGDRHERKYRAISNDDDSEISTSNRRKRVSASQPPPPPFVSTENNDDNNDNNNNDTSSTNNNNTEHLEENRLHPDIPATSIAKKFMDMASQLDQSPLRTIKKTHLMDIPPRIRHQINYVQARDTDERRLGDQQQQQGKSKPYSSRHTTTTQSHSSLSSSSPPPPSTPLPLLSPSIANNSTEVGELIFTFSIYQSLKPTKKLQEFHVLGSQTLTELRDALFCRMDFSAHGDRINNDPDGEVINTFRQKRSASYFYIDKTFYVDQRLGDGADLSASIRDWLPGDFAVNVTPMNALTLRDLPLQLNTPYLFDHQQHCQHVVMLRDIRLLESRDKRQADQYPIVTYGWRYRRLKCNMCMIYPAVYVTTNDYLSGFSPCFFCERCYEPFHFDKSGNAVTTFDVCAYHGT